MCFKISGPAISPSFVMCPIKNVSIFNSFAFVAIADEHSLICEGLPEIDDNCELYNA